MPGDHQQGADVGEAQAQRAVVDRTARRSRRDGNCAISHRDLEHDGPEPAGVLEARPTSKRLSRRRGTCIRLSDARLQAVSSRNMYSEHGLEARIGPDAGQVCQSLMVVSNWMPGSARGPGGVGDLVPEVARLERLAWRVPSDGARVERPSRRRPRPRFRKSSVTRTELLEFWPETVR